MMKKAKPVAVVAKPTTPLTPQEKLLSTVRDFDRSIDNLTKSLSWLRFMRAECVKTYVKKYGDLPTQLKSRKFSFDKD